MIVYITGGERSGKSAFAEAELTGKDVCYIATAYYDDKDFEMKDRIKKHRERRPSSWRTFEGYRNLSEAIGEEKYYLLDCITNLVSRIMYELSFDKELSTLLIRQIEDEAALEIETFFSKIRALNKNLYAVSNEIGMTMISMDIVGRTFTDILGRINQKAQALSDGAFFDVSGAPMRLK